MLGINKLNVFSFTILYVILFGMLLIYLILKHNYQKTEYYQATHFPYYKLFNDTGRLGEYYTFKYLFPLKGYKRFLFNCYVPKEAGTDTEIDVIMLHESGIYVFESKNYSGWIFGTENQKQWTQTLPSGRNRSKKSYFFNPIMQNKGHIKWLKAYLNEGDEYPFYSYIVFSDRCELKNVTLTSQEHYVVNQYNLLRSVSHNASISGVCLTHQQIDWIYNLLIAQTQVSDEVKKAHVKTIRKTYYETSKERSYKTERICPRCGSSLVIRTSKKGVHAGEQFYGCSNFPSCRYMEKLDK